MAKYAEGIVNQTRFHALFDAAVEGMVVIGPDGLISDTNPATERLFGYSSEELAGQNVSVLMPEPDRSNHDDYLKRYRSESTPRVIGIGREVIGRHKEGRLFPVYLSVGEFKTPTLEGYVGILRDLTESKSTADKLLSTKAELESTLKYAPVAILTLNQHGVIQKSNDAAGSMLNLAETAGPSSIVDATAETDRPRQIEILNQVWSGEVSGAKETLHYVVPGQATLLCSGHYALVQAPQGEAAFIILELADLTPLVNAEQDAALHREQLALAGRVEALGEMAVSIAHELNQPLAAITLYAQTASRLLANETGANPVLESILEKIAAQALRAGQVIKQVRALVSKSADETETHDLREIVQEALRLGEVDARANGIALNVEIADYPVWVNADPIQLQQVVLNLVRNAFDALSSDRPASPRVRLSLTTANDQVIVKVCDNGPGVDEGIIENLFQPFVTSKDYGMGIGLSLSQTIVKRHHGSLKHAAAEGGGACFTMSLPLIQLSPDNKAS